MDSARARASAKESYNVTIRYFAGRTGVGVRGTVNYSARAERIQLIEQFNRARRATADVKQLKFTRIEAWTTAPFSAVTKSLTLLR